jgi:hypothetical protein
MTYAWRYEKAKNFKGDVDEIDEDSKPNIQKKICKLYDQCLPLEELDVHIFLPLDLAESKSNDLKTRILLEHNKIENIKMCLQIDWMNLISDPLSFNGSQFPSKSHLIIVDWNTTQWKNPM